MIIPPEDLARWKALCDELKYPFEMGVTGQWITCNGAPILKVNSDLGRDFALAARTALPALIAEVERLRREVNACVCLRRDPRPILCKGGDD